MSVYVDPLAHYGWKLRGAFVESCHMFTDSADLTQLHKIARQIGMKRIWFQSQHRIPHYDLVASRRTRAIAMGAIAVDFKTAVAIWQKEKKDVSPR